MTTTTTIATITSDKPAAPQTIPALPTSVLSDAIYVELAPKASLDMDGMREIQLNVQTLDETDAETEAEAANESEVLLFIAVDHAKPARFEPAVVKAEPGFDYIRALGDSAAIRSDLQGFEFTFYIDEPCDHVICSFVYADPQFGILERVGQLFVGVRVGDLQAFAALTVRAAGAPNAHLPMESSAGGNGIMLKLVNSATGERMYSRFVLLPKTFMTALRRAIARQLAASNQMPVQLQLATHYSAFFDSDQSMYACWAAARHISVGKDCPVQRIWIRAFESFAVVEEADSP